MLKLKIMHPPIINLHLFLVKLSNTITLKMVSHQLLYQFSNPISLKKYKELHLILKEK